MATPTHKSATSVTLAPLAEKSAFAVFVSKYWLYGVAVFLAVSAWILYSHQRSQEQKKQRDQSWEKVGSRTTLEGFPRIPSADPEAFAALAAELKGSDAGPWTRWLEANSLLNQRKFAQAKSALDQLRSEYPNHPLVAEKWPVGDEQSSLIDAWAKGIAARQAWEAEHASLFANPPPAEGSPRVRLKTELGDIEITLYAAQAPQHAQNFLDLAAEGYYNGTKFHRIDPQMGVDGGDPNSRLEDLLNWGQGGADKLLPYADNGLYHFEGVLTAASGATRKESLGSRFSILVEDRHDLDGQRVVFGVVTSGLEVVRQMATAAQAADGSGRPEKPVALVSIERL